MVQIGRLDHVNLRTAELDRLIDWYGRVLNIHPGKRPDIPVPGAWLYTDGLATIHVNVTSDAPRIDNPTLEHFSFRATGLRDFIARLKREKEPYETVLVPGVNLVQVNVFDPDGNHIHIDFGGEEAGSIDQREIGDFRDVGERGGRP